jgi:RHS repeat-associated protein
VQQDANWNTTALTDASGAVQQRFTYDPYGKATARDASTWASTTDAYTFTELHQGGRQDTVTGLVNHRERDDNVSTGGWQQADPAGYIDGANRYQATLANPLYYVDPRGLQAWPGAGNPFDPFFGPAFPAPPIKPWVPEATQPSPKPYDPRPSEGLTPGQVLMPVGPLPAPWPFTGDTIGDLAIRSEHTLVFYIAYGGGQIGATVGEVATFIFHDAWVGRNGRPNLWGQVHHQMMETWHQSPQE